MATDKDIFRLVIFLAGGNYVIINLERSVIQPTLTKLMDALLTRSESNRWFRCGDFHSISSESIVDLLAVQGYQCIPYEKDPTRIAAESVKRIADSAIIGDEWKEQ